MGVFIDQITGYIAENIDENEIERVEENAGSIWIILKNGQVKSIMFIDCEDPDSQ